MEEPSSNSEFDTSPLDNNDLWPAALSTIPDVAEHSYRHERLQRQSINAEARAPGVPSNLLNLDSQKIPWSTAPARNRRLLAAGRSVGGPIEGAFDEEQEQQLLNKALGYLLQRGQPLYVGTLADLPIEANTDRCMQT